MKRYRPPGIGAFKFPFRHGRKTQATGSYNAPAQGRPSKQMPPIKQFTQMKPGRPAQRPKGKR